MKSHDKEQQWLAKLDKSIQNEIFSTQQKNPATIFKFIIKKYQEFSSNGIDLFCCFFNYSAQRYQEFTAPNLIILNYLNNKTLQDEINIKAYPNTVSLYYKSLNLFFSYFPEHYPILRKIFKLNSHAQYDPQVFSNRFNKDMIKLLPQLKKEKNIFKNFGFEPSAKAIANFMHLLNGLGKASQWNYEYRQHANNTLIMLLETHAAAEYTYQFRKIWLTLLTSIPLDAIEKPQTNNLKKVIRESLNYWKFERHVPGCLYKNSPYGYCDFLDDWQRFIKCLQILARQDDNLQLELFNYLISCFTKQSTFKFDNSKLEHVYQILLEELTALFKISAIKIKVLISEFLHDALFQAQLNGNCLFSSEEVNCGIWGDLYIKHNDFYYLLDKNFKYSHSGKAKYAYTLPAQTIDLLLIPVLTAELDFYRETHEPIPGLLLDIALAIIISKKKIGDTKSQATEILELTLKYNEQEDKDKIFQSFTYKYNWLECAKAIIKLAKYFPLQEQIILLTEYTQSYETEEMLRDFKYRATNEELQHLVGLHGRTGHITDPTLEETLQNFEDIFSQYENNPGLYAGKLDFGFKRFYNEFNYLKMIFIRVDSRRQDFILNVLCKAFAFEFEAYAPPELDFEVWFEIYKLTNAQQKAFIINYIPKMFLNNYYLKPEQLVEKLPIEDCFILLRNIYCNPKHENLLALKMNLYSKLNCEFAKKNLVDENLASIFPAPVIDIITNYAYEEVAVNNQNLLRSF